MQRVPTESQRRNDSLGRGLGTPSRRRSPGYATTGNFQDRTWPDRERSEPPAVRPPGHSDTRPKGPPQLDPWRQLGLSGSRDVWVTGVSTLDPTPHGNCSLTTGVNVLFHQLLATSPHDGTRASTGGKFQQQPLPCEHSVEARCKQIMMMRVSGFSNRRPAPENLQTICLPESYLHIRSSAVIWRAALAALLACGLVSQVLATPLADVTGASDGPVDETGFPLADCCARTATLLQDIAVLQRSLSQCADSSAASGARADALAGKLLEWERTASRLQLENTALRSRLEAPPSPEEMPEPTAANSQPRSSSSHTAQLSANAGRVPYPATLPVFGAHPAGHWDGLLAEVALISRMAGALLGGLRLPGFCSCIAARSSIACCRGRRYPDPHARTHTSCTPASIACIRVP